MFGGGGVGFGGWKGEGGDGMDGGPVEGWRSGMEKDGDWKEWSGVRE